MRIILIILSLFLLAFDLSTTTDAMITADRILSCDLGAYPGIRPCQGRVSSGFGQRWGRLHAGIDIANQPGTPIYSTGSGTVIYVGWSPGRGGYGYHVKVQHTARLTVIYAHLRYAAVRGGDEVLRGDHIGNMGNTGRTVPRDLRGVHLHYELRINGVPVNPETYLMR